MASSLSVHELEGLGWGDASLVLSRWHGYFKSVALISSPP
jgi:hypothetical protein